MISDRVQMFEGKRENERFAQEFVQLAGQYPCQGVSLQIDPGATPSRRWLQLCFKSPSGATMISETMSAEAGPKEVLRRVKLHLEAYAAT